MNVQEALTRLKEARAYSGRLRSPTCPHRSGSPYLCGLCRDELDTSYKRAVDTLETEEKNLRSLAAMRLDNIRQLDFTLADILRKKFAAEQQLASVASVQARNALLLKAQEELQGKLDAERIASAALRDTLATVKQISEARYDTINALAVKLRDADDYREAYEALRRQGQVSEEFRKNPNKNWATSYTKKVVDKLKALHVYLYLGGPLPLNKQTEVREAIDLLTDYHNTMHVAYQQRDEARTTLATVRSQLEQAQGHIRELANRLAEVRKALDKKVVS